jgi:hypothetical protein
MNKIELKKIAVKKLNTKSVQKIKKQLCENFSDKKQKEDCMIGFDKGFIESFIKSYRK